jgi:transcriptional regulator with XRE-family HTH domain
MGYGEFIKRNRIASGFTRQVQLADKSGITPATISRIEKELQKPSVETLRELAPFLTSTTYAELMVVCGYGEKEERGEMDKLLREYEEKARILEGLESLGKNMPMGVRLVYVDFAVRHRFSHKWDEFEIHRNGLNEANALLDHGIKTTEQAIKYYQGIEKFYDM